VREPLSMRLWIEGHLPTCAVLSLLLTFSHTAPPWDNGSSWEIGSKIEGLEALVYYRPEPFDLSLGMTLMVLLVALLLAGTLRVPRCYWRPFAALGLVFLAAPEVFQGVAFTDERLPLCIACLLLGCVKVRSSTTILHKRLVNLCVVVMVILALLKPLAMWLQIRPLLQLADDVARVFRVIPSGSRIIIAQSQPDFRVFDMEAWHLPIAQLVQGDYFFPLLFDNYFVTFRPTVTSDMRNLSDIPQTPPRFNCRGATHLVLLGSEPGQFGVIPDSPKAKQGLVAVYGLQAVPPQPQEPPCRLW
jgi:hypothetical protein